jgi:cysteine synthase
MVEAAEASGALSRAARIVESDLGQYRHRPLAIGAAVKGYRLILVMRREHVGWSGGG